jgi:hypothetical protein
LYPEREDPGKGGTADGQIVQNLHNLENVVCTLHYQLYLHGQDNNAAESLASICNNSANNELHDVSAVGNVGGDHAITNNNRDVAFVNNVGDTEIIHNSCGTGPDVHVDNQLGMGDVVGDNDMAHRYPVYTMALKSDGLIILSHVSLLLLGTWWWSFDH